MIEHEIVQRQILRGRSATLAVQFFQDGEPHDPGVVTVGIVDAAGDTVVASGATTGGSDTGPRTYELAAQSDLDLLTVTWTLPGDEGFEDRVEVVGAFLFTMREARTFRSGDSGLSDDEQFPTQMLEAARQRITDDFANAMGVSHIPRYRELTLTGSGSATMALPDLHILQVRSIDALAAGDDDWTPIDLASVMVRSGGMLWRRDGGRWDQWTTYRIAYEHGHREPPPAVKRAALVLLHSMAGVFQTSWDPRATGMRSEYGFITVATAGRGGATYGLPEVDAIIDRYSEHVPGVA